MPDDCLCHIVLFMSNSNDYLSLRHVNKNTLACFSLNSNLYSTQNVQFHIARESCYYGKSDFILVGLLEVTTFYDLSYFPNLNKVIIKELSLNVRNEIIKHKSIKELEILNIVVAHETLCEIIRYSKIQTLGIRSSINELVADEIIKSDSIKHLKCKFSTVLNHLGNSNDYMLIKIINYSKIQKLDLSSSTSGYSSLDENGNFLMKIMESIGENKYIKSLNLSGNHIYAMDIRKILIPLRKNICLEEIYLDDNPHLYDRIITQSIKLLELNKNIKHIYIRTLGKEHSMGVCKKFYYKNIYPNFADVFIF